MLLIKSLSTTTWPYGATWSESVYNTNLQNVLTTPVELQAAHLTEMYQVVDMVKLYLGLHFQSSGPCVSVLCVLSTSFHVWASLPSPICLSVRLLLLAARQSVIDIAIVKRYCYCSLLAQVPSSGCNVTTAAS